MTPTGLLISLAGVAQSFGRDLRSDLPRPHKCPTCYRAFRRLEHQKRHIRTHTREKPYVCLYPRCMKTFSRSDELIRHSRIHGYSKSRRFTRKNRMATAADTISRVPQFWTRTTPPLPLATNTFPQPTPSSGITSFVSSTPLFYVESSEAVHPNIGLYGIGLGGSSKSAKEPTDTNVRIMTTSKVESLTQTHSNYSPSPYKSEPNQHLSYRKKDVSATSRARLLIQDQKCFRLFSKHNLSNSLKPLTLISPKFSHVSISSIPNHGPSFQAANLPPFESYGNDTMCLPNVQHRSLEQVSTTVPPSTTVGEKDGFDAGEGSKLRVLRISQLLS